MGKGYWEWGKGKRKGEEDREKGKGMASRDGEREEGRGRGKVEGGREKEDGEGERGDLGRGKQDEEELPIKVLEVKIEG